MCIISLLENLQRPRVSQHYLSSLFITTLFMQTYQSQLTAWIVLLKWFTIQFCISCSTKTLNSANFISFPSSSPSFNEILTNQTTVLLQNDKHHTGTGNCWYEEIIIVLWKNSSSQSVLVTVYDINTPLKGLNKGRAAGPDAINTQAFIFRHHRLYVHITLLFLFVYFSLSVTCSIHVVSYCVTGQSQSW
jgi:hypothetical protein